MRCGKCKKNLNNETIAFCEKCEEYYCMNCSTKHRKHNLTFFKVKNNMLTEISTRMGGAGIGKRHHKFYTDEKWIFRHQNCGHIENSLNKDQPIFLCEDNKIRCPKCFYKSKLNLANPLIEIKKNEFMYLLTQSYEPQNLNFDFTCDNIGIKGEKSKLILSIENNKKQPINDITLTIEAYAAEPLPKNKSYAAYVDRLDSRCLIYEKLYFESIESKITLKKELKIKIPNDYEIKKNTFFDGYQENDENEYEKDGFLKVPNNLMIYANFTYKTYSGFEFSSEIKNSIIQLI